MLPHRGNLPQIERPAHGGPVPLGEQRPDIPGKAGDGVGGGWVDGPGWDACFRLPTSGIDRKNALSGNQFDIDNAGSIGGKFAA